MSATKRRAGAAASPELDTPDPVKKRKKTEQETYYPEEENAETTSEIGLKLVEQLKKSKDKTGRNVAGHFLTLPDKREYPQYYDQVKVPIALDTVEERLLSRKYPTMETLESDLKRLVQNAKEFNSTKSEVYEDAERIRKALSNFMPKHNPAYQNPSYRAYPTPIPRDAYSDQTNGASTHTPNVNGTSDNLKIVFPSNMAKRRKSRALSSDDDDVVDDLVSKQVDIVDEMMELPNSENFHKKPNKRRYPDYYEQIVHPTSLTDIREMANNGQFDTWESFIAEMRCIWGNARQYNEEESQIYEFAEDLETWFEDHISKSGIAPKKLKLNLKRPEGPRLTLKFGKEASTPAPGGGLIDSDSLRRQREDTGQALNKAQTRESRESSKVAVLGPPTGSAPSSTVNASRKRSMSAVGTPEIAPPARIEDAVKDSSSEIAVAPGKGAQLSDAQLPPTAQVMPASTMQPPQFAIGPPPPGSQHVGQIGFAPGATMKSAFERDSPFDRVHRDVGKGLNDALLSGVTFLTCPRMPHDPKWKKTLYASGTKTQISSYIYLPSDHYYLRVIPQLTEEIRSRKKYKLVVCRNWETLFPQQDLPGAYDFRIHPGENNIVVDVVAELAEGETKAYAPPQLQLDFERIQFIIFLRDPTPE